MKRILPIALCSLMWLSLPCPQAQAWGHGGLVIGVGIGIPCYRPYYYGPAYYYGAPYPVYVAPAPVVVQPAPVVVQPAPAPRSAQTVESTESGLPLTPVRYTNGAEVDRNLQLLADPSEKVRLDAVLQLGKMKAARAVDPVAATLAGDRSPQVRDAAARALGLIGSPRGLTALKYAAQADNDRDVRHSAQFAVEVIQSNMKR